MVQSPFPAPLVLGIGFAAPSPASHLPAKITAIALATVIPGAGIEDNLAVGADEGDELDEVFHESEENWTALPTCPYPWPPFPWSREA